MSIHNVGTYTPGLGDGLPGNQTLPGSGLAVPAGLEAALEYNGLLMNVRENVDKYKITGMDGLADADIRDTRDNNTDDDGETPYNSFYGGRTITLTGKIQTYSVAKLRDMTMALKAAFSNISTEYPLRFRTGDFTKDHMIYCKKIGSIAIAEQQTDFLVHRDFQISLRASDPRFLSFYQRFFVINPSVILIGDDLLTTIINLGDYTAKAVYRMYGPSSGVTIANAANGQSFTVGEIPLEDWLEFDTAKKTLKDSHGNNKWSLLSDDSDYVLLESGRNPILYTGDCQRVQISWHDSWI